MRTSARAIPVVLFLTALTLGAQSPPGGPPLLPVAVEVATEEDFVPTTTIVGSTEPKRRSVLAASIEGYVIEYGIEEGDTIAEGEVLCRMRDTILRLHLREATAALEEARERHRKARVDLDRARKLIAKGATTQKDLDAAVSEEKSLALRIPQAEARLEILKSNIARKVVRAPYAGQIVREHSQVGEWLIRGGPVATIVDLSTIYVRLNVPERYIRHVMLRSSVPVWVAAAADEPFDGAIVSVSGDGDPDARTFAVRIALKNESGVLRAGMSARVELPTGRSHRGIAVAKDALMMEGRQNFVFVVGPAGRAHRRAVRLGAAKPQRVEVVRGIAAGERIVIRGNERLRPEVMVRIVETGASAKTDDPAPPPARPEHRRP